MPEFKPDLFYLQGVDFSYVNLSSANLSEANLSCTTLV
ncbi:pentapeptide repeat-containing protein [Nostoc sp.]